MSSKKSGTPRRARTVRYAVVGAGWIAQSAVLPAFAHAKSNSRLAAIVSGTPRKRRELGERYGVEATYSYREYDACLRSGGIDAVYIALPNDLHHEFAVRAAEAGVHVLCEKPLAVTEGECLDMIRAARTNRVRLMTAYRLHFERTNLEAVERVRSGELGEPRLLTSVFTMQIKPGNIRLGPVSRGGGPLYDIGIYCINAARCLFRSEPVEVHASAVHGGDPRFRRCPESVAAVMRFPRDRMATFVASFGAAPVATYRIVGTEGDLRIDQVYETAEEMTSELTVDEKTRKSTTGKRDQFAPELIHFSDCVLRGRDPEPSGHEGLADVRVIRALHRSIDLGRAVRLAPMTRKRRPTMRLEMRRPPVGRQDLVGTAPATY